MIRRRTYLRWAAVAGAAASVGTVDGVGPTVGEGRRRDASTPDRSAKLHPDDGDGGDEFGRTVSVDGPTALVGAPGDDDPAGEWSGSAYVFERADGEWTQRTKLVSADGGEGAWFGAGVSVDGDTAVVGAPNEDSAGANAGAAYVFDRDGTEWTRAAKLVPTDLDANDGFGHELELSGDAVLVGAPGDEGPNGADGGSAFVFERSNGTWTRRAKLSAADGDGGDLFGRFVALDGTTAVVGAPSDEDPNGENAGAAYVFERSGGTWPQRAKLAPDDGTAGDLFGTSVGVAGDSALVGAYHHSSLAEDAGAAYVFERSGGEWPQRAKLVANDGERRDLFGSAVALSDRRAVVGADNAASAYVFERGDTGWTQLTELVVDGAAGNVDFGYVGSSVATGGGAALVGAPGDATNGARSGAVYVFRATTASKTSTTGASGTSDPTPEPSPDEEGASPGGDDRDTTGGQPGFAPWEPVVAIGGAGYLLRRSRSDEGSDPTE